MKHLLFCVVFAAIPLVVVGGIRAEAPTGKATKLLEPSAVLAKAAKANKYVFALFWKSEKPAAATDSSQSDSPQTQSKARTDLTSAMRTTLRAAIKQKPLAGRVTTLDVDVTSAQAKTVVERFHLEYAPLPLLLCIAPNGAVTAGFPDKVSHDDLKSALTTPGTEKCLKAFQDDKILVICVQNAKSSGQKVALQAVRDFQNDERFKKDTAVVIVDPVDDKEAELMTNLGVDPKTREAVTILFAPPARRVGEFAGELVKDELVETLIRGLSGFG